MLDVVEGAVGVGNAAAGDGAGEAKGGSEGHHVLSDDERAAVTELDGGEGDVLAFGGVHVHLDDGEVCPVIVADESGGDAFFVGESYIDFDGAAGDVVVGKDVALLVDERARAVAADEALLAVFINGLGDINSDDGGGNCGGYIGDASWGGQWVGIGLTARHQQHTYNRQDILKTYSIWHEQDVDNMREACRSRNPASSEDFV